jgi:hypothetical protein
MHVGESSQTIQGLLRLGKCRMLHMLHGCLSVSHSLPLILNMVSVQRALVMKVHGDLHQDGGKDGNVYLRFMC